MHPSNSFITLTYNKEHLPKDASLHVEHWQAFAKRLRKQTGPFRYFHCGEYGDQNHRPHYHACLFGIDFASDRVLLRQTQHSDLYTSPLLQQAWGQGYVTVGNLTYESAAYVARYCMKKLTAPNIDYQGRTPEYVTMSRRPGIGSTWFDQFHNDVYPADEIIHNGRTFRPPRFYDEKLSEEMLQQIKNNRADKAARSAIDLTPDRLRTREQVQLAKNSTLQKTL